MLPSSSREAGWRPSRKMPKAQPAVNCAHCGKRRNILSTWLSGHVGRVCYTCIQSGNVPLFKEV